MNGPSVTVTSPAGLRRTVVAVEVGGGILLLLDLLTRPVGLILGLWCIATALAAHKGLEDLSLTEFQAASPLFAADVREHLTLEGALASRDVTGGTAPARVQEALAHVQA